MANQQRAALTESLLDDNINEDCVRSGNGGAGGLPNLAASSVTTILVLSAFVVACTAFGFGNAVGYSSPTQSGIMEDLGLSVAEFSLFGSLLTIGAMLGAVISGKITDLLGRKGTVDFEFVLHWWVACHSFHKVRNTKLACVFEKVPWLLDLGRFALGFRNGIAGYLMPIYVAEVAPKNLRGRISTLGTLMVCWGLSFMYVVGSFVSWRTLALIATIPGLLQLPLLFFIPESPRWLAKVGRQNDLEAALQSLRGDKVDISEEATEIKDYTELLRSASKGSILDVFEQRFLLDC